MAGGILKVGGQYKRAAITGAITGAKTAQARTSAQRALDLRERELEQKLEFQEESLSQQEAAAERQRNASLAMLAITIGGFF